MGRFCCVLGTFPYCGTKVEMFSHTKLQISPCRLDFADNLDFGGPECKGLDGSWLLSNRVCLASPEAGLRELATSVWNHSFWLDSEVHLCVRVCAVVCVFVWVWVHLLACLVVCLYMSLPVLYWRDYVFMYSSEFVFMYMHVYVFL